MSIALAKHPSNPKSSTNTGRDKPSSPVRLAIPNHTFEVQELTGFSFSLFCPGDAAPEVRKGVLEAEGLEPLDILFRPRNIPGTQQIRCSFIDVSTQDRKKLDKFVALFDGSNSSGDELEEMSYDEIAGAKSKPSKGDEKVKSAKGVRSAQIATVFGVMAAILVVGAIIIWGIVKSKGSIPLSHSSLVGNYLAVESLSPGVIERMNVSADETVEKGQILFYVEASEDVREVQDRVHEVQELESQIEVYRFHVAQAEEELQSSLITMEADFRAFEPLLKQASLAVKACEKHEKNLRGLLREGIIGAPRVDEATVKTAEARLELETHINEQRQLRERLEAAREGRFTQNESSKNQLQTNQLALGLAEVRLETLLKRQKGLDSLIPVRAPMAGKVSTVYQVAGTYVKAGDTVVGLTRNDEPWAIGHILAKDAPKVKPGLTVTVKVPSMKKTFTGYISGVGHRSVYSKGEWSSDFRTSVPSSTPIKVSVPELKDLPSGLRMKMTVKLDDVWPWQSWYDRTFKKSDLESPSPAAEGEPTFAKVTAK